MQLNSNNRENKEIKLLDSVKLNYIKYHLNNPTGMKVTSNDGPLCTCHNVIEIVKSFTLQNPS